MNREGEGNVAPKPQIERLTKGALALLEREAQRRQAFRRYSERSDRWGHGLTDDPILRGLVGEQALAQFANRRAGTALSVDFRLLRGGDGGRDFVAYGDRIQVKCKGRRNGRNLIRRIDDRGELRPLDFDVCVFAQWSSDALHRREALLLGWVTADDVREFGIRERSPVSIHHNIRIEDTRLRPMHQLIERLELRRSA